MKNSEEIKTYLKQLKFKHKVKLYTPLKYFQGLKTKKDIETRFLRILQGSRSNTSDKNAYKPFITDIKQSKPKTSKYTKAFYTLYPKAKSLKQKSIVTGIPYDIIKQVYDKGLAAWRTGHRVGASQQAWGYARVHSFIMLGCAAFTADKKLLLTAIKKMSKKNIDSWRSHKILCTGKKLFF